jgi:hypothetical protein
MGEQSIQLTRAQAIRIVQQAAYRVPRDTQHPWACALCSMPSREILDCIHAVDCPIGAIRAQLSEEEYHHEVGVQMSEESTSK